MAKELTLSPLSSLPLSTDTADLLARFQDLQRAGNVALQQLGRTTQIAEGAAEKAEQAEKLSELAMNQACAASNASTVANQTANLAHQVAADAQQVVAGVAEGQQFLAQGHELLCQELEILRQQVATLSARPSTVAAQPKAKPQPQEVCPHGVRCNQPHCIHRGGHGTEAERILTFMQSSRIALFCDGKGAYNGICACGSQFQLSAKGQWHTKCRRDCQGAHH